MYDLIILGSGPAGLTAAIYATRAGLKTLLIAGNTWGGQPMTTTMVENFPGFPEGIQGPQLMTNIRRQAERFGAEIINRDFTAVDFSVRPFKIFVDKQLYRAKSAIIATGARSIWLEAAGEKNLRGKGVSICATCDGFFFRGKDVLVVGGGDAAMEDALVLAKIARSVTIVHRRNQFRASKVMQEKVFAEPKIKIVWNAELVQYNGETKLESINLKLKAQSSKLQLKAQNKNIHVTMEQFINEAMKLFGGGKILEQKKDYIIWQLPVDGVFVAVGHRPNSEKLEGIEIDSKGYVVRKEIKDEKGLVKYTTATNIAGVFTAGDVSDYRYRQSITAAGSGCMAALDAQRWLEESNI